ncbi:MAG: NDP-sugar synthase [Nitrososphaerota archaeon]|nr:NDP-sugar synthase [Nitrososphaerota archaeon]
MKAVILAGGKGLRFRPFTDSNPKALVPVNGKPIADWQLEWLKKNSDVREIIFACGHKWEGLKEHFGTDYSGIPVKYAVETEPLGTGGGLRNVLRSFMSVPVGDDKRDNLYIVMNGDVLTDLPIPKLIDWHVTNDATVTMALVPYKSPFGVVRIDKLKVVRKFEEKPEFLDAWINGGIYLINGSKVERFLPEKGDIERETFPKLVERGEILSYPYYGFWRAIDSIKDLKIVESELSTTSR